MSRAIKEANLSRLLGEFAEYAAANGIPRPSGPPSRLCSEMFLAHSRSDATFERICNDNRILSARELHARGGKPLGDTEAALCTDDDVFFYVAPFRYPNTTCGFLFKAALEAQSTASGTCTPFDSGGLLEQFGRPDMAETAVDFLRRHELPLTEHRQLFHLALETLFAAPLDYVRGRDPARPGPIGLTGGDHRRWTFEVRIHKHVHVRVAEFQALFVPSGRHLSPGINRMLRWCNDQGLDHILFNAPRGGEFAVLQRECTAYILSKCL